jgi:hypothetical protein
MTQEIIVHPLLITKAGEQQYFQVNIPRDVISIVGITNSIQLMQKATVSETGQVGFLQLQATGRANGCYNSIVKLEPIEALKTDLSLSSYQAGFLHLDLIQKNGIAQRGMNSPETIHLPSCNCFYGNYKDLLGRLLSQDISYRLSITLWTQVKRI